MIKGEIDLKFERFKNDIWKYIQELENQNKNKDSRIKELEIKLNYTNEELNELRNQIIKPYKESQDKLISVQDNKEINILNNPMDNIDSLKVLTIIKDKEKNCPYCGLTLYKRDAKIACYENKTDIKEFTLVLCLSCISCKEYFINNNILNEVTTKIKPYSIKYIGVDNNKISCMKNNKNIDSINNTTSNTEPVSIDKCDIVTNETSKKPVVYKLSSDYFIEKVEFKEIEKDKKLNIYEIIEKDKKNKDAREKKIAEIKHKYNIKNMNNESNNMELYKNELKEINKKYSLTKEEQEALNKYGRKLKNVTKQDVLEVIGKIDKNHCKIGIVFKYKKGRWYRYNVENINNINYNDIVKCKVVIEEGKYINDFETIK